MAEIPILLVEDDEIDTELFRRMLKKERVDVDRQLYVARDGVEALEMLNGKNGRQRVPQPCIILLDINLPRMTGLELLSVLRGSDLMSCNIVFILTTSEREEDLSSAYRLNAAGYILKENAVSLVKFLTDYRNINVFPANIYNQST